MRAMAGRLGPVDAGRQRRRRRGRRSRARPPQAQALLGKTRRADRRRDVLAVPLRQGRATAWSLPAGATPAEGASCFVNPLTALGMVETMRREGHKALVHTAAASNLGQMLNRICLEDGIALVNIVRSAEQAELLRDIGAAHVVQLGLRRPSWRT